MKRRSLESLSRSHNLDMPKDPEGVANYAINDARNAVLESLNDLTAIWIFNEESGERENKLDTIKMIEGFLKKDEPISIDFLQQKIKDGVSLSEMSASF